MAAMTTRSSVTNQRVADDLGVTHSAVSRIRGGVRRPSLELMLKIAEVFNWPLEAQALAWSLGVYTVGFEDFLGRHYDQ